VTAPVSKALIRSHGVGILGGGLATQAIHLPVLATLPEQFHVVRVMNPTLELAQRAAMRCRAAGTTSVDEVLDDPKIEVVAICSPHAAHAAQVIAACEAGKKLVMCEKPLAMNRTEGEAIAAAARKSGTVVIVGTQHAHDLAYRAAGKAWAETGDHAHFVQSAIYLPTNDIFIDQATDPLALKPPPVRQIPDRPDAEFDTLTFQRMMLGLAIHNIPLVRDFYPAAGKLTSARFLRPAGYSARATDGACIAEFLAVMHGDWPPRWTMRVIGAKHELRIAFPPSYVLAGSARVELVSGGETRVFERPVSGYEAMWRHISAILGGETPLIPLSTAIADLGFAIDLGDQARPLLASAT
jgi:myo-inositol 2-dehydrogenase / D-chiro-inositol 1-dehydrogenase